MEELIKKAEATIAPIRELLNKYGYPDDPKTLVAVCFIDQSFEHHAALMMLIRQGLTGSAFALLRSLVEIMYRGVWIVTAASANEVRRFVEKDEIRLTMAEMAEATDKACNIDFFLKFKKKAWEGMNSYAHTGLLQLGRRFKSQQLAPAYTNEEISQLISIATGTIVMLVRPFLAFHGHVEDAKKMDQLGEAFGREWLR
jgi:hypothetical protein